MEYEIFNDGKLIAIFKYENDRDVCLGVFEDLYPDCKFTILIKE